MPETEKLLLEFLKPLNELEWTQNRCATRSKPGRYPERGSVESGKIPALWIRQQRDGVPFKVA